MESSPAKDPVGHSQQVWRNDLKNPFNWSRSKKWAITLTAAIITLLVGLNSTAVATPSHAIVERFRVSDSDFPNSYWPVTVWNTGAAFGGLVGLPLLENFGTRNGYMVKTLGTVRHLTKADCPFR